jgi:hypothetical protein
VWWDRRIPAGRAWRSVLEEGVARDALLDRALVRKLHQESWVIEEAEEARRLGKIMLSVLIHKINPPEFARQAAKLIDWGGWTRRPWELLVADLKALLGEPKAPTNGNVGRDRANDSAKPRQSPQTFCAGCLPVWKILEFREAQRSPCCSLLCKYRHGRSNGH